MSRIRNTALNKQPHGVPVPTWRCRPCRRGCVPPPLGARSPWNACCGTVTNFYGSGSDFWKVMVPVPVPTFEKLWFRFRFLLVKSYGSGSSSISRPQKAYFSTKFLEFFLLFYCASCFTRKKFINFSKFIVKCERKIFKWRKSNT